MSNKYAGTQTEKNLEAAFAGESQARNKYTYFASAAKKQGFEQIASLFLKTADNEKEHAKMWFKELNGIGDTAQIKPHIRNAQRYTVNVRGSQLKKFSGLIQAVSDSVPGLYMAAAPGSYSLEYGITPEWETLIF